MKALYFQKKKLSFHKDHVEPVMKSGEALIRVLAVGICSTDLEIIKGYMGFQGIPGHEFVGVVEKSPDPGWLEKRVVGSINLGCGKCPVCSGSGPEHCPERSVLGIFRKDGAFAEFLTLPLANLYEVPENITDEEAVFTEPLAAALRICDQVAIGPSSKIAVVGPGRLGLLIGQVLSRTGAELLMLGRSEESLALAGKNGLDSCLAREIPDSSFDIVVEATGNQEGFAQSLRLVRPQGTMILKSTFAEKSGLDLTKIVVDEVKVVGSRCGPFKPALRLLENGAVKVFDLIEAEYPLKEGIAAFEHAACPGAMKVLMKP